MTAALLIAVMGAISAETVFDEALLAQQEGRYAAAAAAYERLVRQGGASPELFHNLGWVYAALGRKGEAIVQWKRALLIDPSLHPARLNLRHSLEELELAGKERDAPAGWTDALRRMAWRWQNIIRLTALAGWILGWVCVVAGMRHSRRSWWASGGAAALLGLFLLAIDGFAHAPGKEAVVIVEEASVHYGAGTEEPVAFTLGEGESVHLETDGGEWARIRTRDFERGWIAADRMVRVGPPFAVRDGGGP